MIVYTQGSFEFIHSGHLNLFKKCRKIAGAGQVVVGVLTDESFIKYRKYTPAKPFSERKKILESIKYVDKVIATDNTRTKQDIQTVNPDIIVVGTDWAVKDIYKQYRMSKDELNPLLVFHPYTTEISSTIIRERVKHDRY